MDGWTTTNAGTAGTSGQLRKTISIPRQFKRPRRRLQRTTSKALPDVRSHWAGTAVYGDPVLAQAWTCELDARALQLAAARSLDRHAELLDLPGMQRSQVAPPLGQQRRQRFGMASAS